MADNNNRTRSFLNQPPSSKEMDSVLERMQKLKVEAVNPVDTKDLDDAEQTARDLYEKRANRSEWLGLAERIGNAVARIGAAKQGLRDGVDLSRVDLGPATDYEARVDRYGRELSTGLQDLAGKRKRLEAQREGTIAENTGKYNRELGGLKEELGVRRDSFREEMDNYRAGMRDSASRSAQEAADRRANERLDRQDKAAADREDKFLLKQEIQDLTAQEKQVEQQRVAAETLINQIQQEGDLPSQSLDKLQTKYGALAAKAGIDLAQLQQDVASKETGWRILGGKSSEEDAAEKRKVLSAEVTRVKNLLDGIKARKANLLRGGGDSDSPPPPPPPGDDQVRVVNPEGKTGTIPRSQLADAIAQGYTEVK